MRFFHSNWNKSFHLISASFLPTFYILAHVFIYPVRCYLFVFLCNDKRNVGTSSKLNELFSFHRNSPYSAPATFPLRSSDFMRFFTPPYRIRTLIPTPDSPMLRIAPAILLKCVDAEISRTSVVKCLADFTPEIFAI